MAIQNVPIEDSDQFFANAQADLNLRLAHMSEGMFSHVEAHVET